MLLSSSVTSFHRSPCCVLEWVSNLWPGRKQGGQEGVFPPSEKLLASWGQEVRA